jgi:hypothetical protein
MRVEKQYMKLWLMRDWLCPVLPLIMGAPFHYPGSATWFVAFITLFLLAVGSIDYIIYSFGVTIKDSFETPEWGKPYQKAV